MRTHTTASPDDIDIGTIWGALKRSLPRLLLVSAAAGGLTFAVLSMMAPRYTSEAQLSVVAKGSQNPFADPKREAAAPDSVTVSVDKEAINTHVRALMSPDLARRIAKEMQLNKKVEFNSALGSVDTVGRVMRMIGLGGPRPGESEDDRVLSAVFRNLEVYSPKESRFIGIRFTSVDPALAAEIANKFADTYRGSLASMRVVETDEVQKALEPKIADLIKEVSAAEAEVERFRAEADRFVGGPQRTQLIEQQLGELTAELTRAQAARSEVEGRARSARELMKAGSADVLPDVQRSPLIQALVQSRVRLERQVSELSATLLPGHPRMQQLNADLAGLKRQISGEVTKLVDSLEKEAKAAMIREETVKKSIDGLKSKVVSTGGDDVKLRQLEAGAKSKRAELERLQAQFESNKARATPGAVPVEAQIITQARTSSVPTFPRKGPYAGLVAAAALLFGMAWVISKALFVGARSQGGSTAAPRTPAQSTPRAEPALAMKAESAVKAAPGAAVPAKPAKAAPEASPVAAPQTDRPGTLAAIRDRVLSNASSQGGYRALVVGDADSVDASFEALALAKDLAASGKQVILVEWSLDGQPVGAKLGVHRTPGLADLLQGAARFEDVIRREPTCNLHILPSGAGIDEREPEIDPEQVNLVLDALDEAYDIIVVTGHQQQVRHLFELIQGRVDAGVTVSDAKPRVSVLQDPPGTLLGYEVTEIDVMSFVRKDAAPSGLQRLLRGGAGAESRPS